MLDCKKGRLFFVAVLFSSAVFVMHLTHRFPLPHTQSNPSADDWLRQGQERVLCEILDFQLRRHRRRQGVQS